MRNHRTRTIFVVDDDPSVRKATERLLRSDGYAVKLFTCAKEFLESRLFNSSSCLVLDVRMPGLNGIQLQEELIKKKILIPIVFITGHGDIPMGVNAMKRGAVDFLPKPFNDQDLLDSIDKAIEKNIAIKKAQSQKDKILRLFKTLTPREQEVMRWVITGLLNKQIAQKLGTTEKTIKVHRGRVMHKMRVPSVAQLLRLAQKAQIDVPPR